LRDFSQKNGKSGKKGKKTGFSLNSKSVHEMRYIYYYYNIPNNYHHTYFVSIKLWYILPTTLVVMFCNFIIYYIYTQLIQFTTSSKEDFKNENQRVSRHKMSPDCPVHHIFRKSDFPEKKTLEEIKKGIKTHKQTPKKRYLKKHTKESILYYCYAWFGVQW